MSKFSTFILSLMFLSSVALAAPDTFVYEGILEDTNGPITSSSTLVLKVYDSSLNCLLYEETQSVTPDSSGAFSVRVGSAVADSKRTTNDPQLSMGKVFLSSGTVRSSATLCPGGYTAASSDSRRLVINVNGTDLSPAVEISSAPFAIAAGTADKVGTYDTSKLLRSDGASAVTALTDAKVTLLMNLLSGTVVTPTSSGDVANKGYVDTVTANYLSASTAFSGDVSGTSTSLSVDKIKGATVDTTGLVANKILKYDGTKWIAGDDNAGSALSLTSGKVWIGNASNGPSEVSLSGDATVAASGLITLKSVGTAGSYAKVVTDAQGRVTSGSGLTSGDITGALGFSPTASTTGFVNGGNSFGAATSIGTNDSQSLSLKTNGTTRMTITTAGNVGIGTTTPANPLDIVGSVNGMLASTVTNTNSAGTSWYRVTNDASHSLQFGVAGTTFSSSGVYAPNTATIYSDVNLAGLNLGTEGAQPMGFFTNNALKMTLDSSGKLGIGTASPSAALTVGDGAANDGQFVAYGYGTVGTSGQALGATGAGTRMLWYPKKAAFRAGAVSSSQWDDTNIGNYSAALGLNVQAKGASSFAAGNSTFANGSYSTAAGFGTIASNTYAVAMGNTASASGMGSVAIGNIVTAESNSQATIGQYNLPTGSETANTWVATDPLFVIGNGTGAGAKSNAMMVLKNGNVGIGTTAGPTTGARLEISGSGTSASSIIIPRDSTANRPTGVNGMIRYATDTNKFEAYENGAWTNMIGTGGGGSGTVTSVAAGSGLTGGPITTTGTLAVDSTTTGVASKILALDSSSVATASGVAIKGSTTGAATLRAPASFTAYSLTLPASAGANGQVMISDGSGNLNWLTPNFLPTGTTANSYAKWNGTSWVEARVNVSTIISSLSTQQFPTNCTVNQTMVWMSASDAYICADTNAATVSTMDKTIYVNASGSDTACNGTTAASASTPPNCAFQTLQKAVDSTPDFIRHKITIEVGSNLTSQGNDKAIAVINKNIAAQSIADGPFLIIKGSTGSEILSQGAFSNGTGIVVGPSASGVYIKEIGINDFQDTGIRIDGGLAVIDNVIFNNNRRGLSVSSAGRAMLGANININLSNSSGTDGSRGIEVYQGSLSSEAAMNINLGSAQNNRGIGIEYGDVSIEEQATISGSGSQYQTGAEVGNGGTLSIKNGYTLRVNMANNFSSTAVRVSNGGHLSVDGTLQPESLANTALVCENNAVCDFYGTFFIPNGSSSPNGYVIVRNGSILNAQSLFKLEAYTNGTGSAAIQVSENSVFKFSPMAPGGILRVYGSGSAVGIRVTNNSQFKVETSMNHNLEFVGLSNMAEVTNMSSATFASNVTGGNSLAMSMDDTSRITAPTGYGYAIPYKLCPGGMMPVGSGNAGFCMDTSNTTQATYYNALNSCSNRGLKLCSKQQYAMYCAMGNSISPAVWTSNIEDLTCGPSSLNASADVISMNYYFRCCQ